MKFFFTENVKNIRIKADFIVLITEFRIFLPPT